MSPLATHAEIAATGDSGSLSTSAPTPTTSSRFRMGESASSHAPAVPVASGVRRTGADVADDPHERSMGA